jgi:hypothetical protein
MAFFSTAGMPWLFSAVTITNLSNDAISMRMCRGIGLVVAPC